MLFVKGHPHQLHVIAANNVSIFLIFKASQRAEQCITV